MPTIINTIMSGLLLPADIPVVAIVIVCGWLFSKKRDIFVQATWLLLFSLIVNTFLKSIWQVPLPAHLNSQSWAFPSGHMQSACVFWGWVAFRYGKIFWQFITVLMLVGVGCGLNYFGYHTGMDLLGAWGAAGGLLVNYYFLVSWLPNKMHYVIPISFAAIGFILIQYIPKYFLHVWASFYSLIIIIIGSYLYDRRNEKASTATT